MRDKLREELSKELKEQFYREHAEKATLLQ
jgi:hypothetical protein